MATKKASPRKPDRGPATRRDATPLLQVFLGWSGPQSKRVAEALHDWLPGVIQAVQPFMSEFDIPSGARWESKLDGELKSAHFGIICLTPENLSAPWVLFECGALSAFRDRAVCPYLYHLKSSDLQGPLTVFQSNPADQAGTLKLVKDLNDFLTIPVDTARLNAQFERCWGELEAKLNAIPESRAPLPKPRSSEQMLEEILMLVRDLARQRQIALSDTSWTSVANVDPGRRGEIFSAMSDAVGEAGNAILLAIGDFPKIDMPDLYRVNPNRLEVKRVFDHLFKGGLARKPGPGRRAELTSAGLAYLDWLKGARPDEYNRAWRMWAGDLPL